ncbi:MAG: hypothetical protein JSW68_07220, partial [Burkholderiales bacterium]
MRKRTRAILIALGLLVALLGLVGWQQRDALLQAALEWALARAGDALVVEAPRASFSGRIEAGRVLYRSPGFTLRADAVRMRLDPVSLWRRELLASELRADRVAIRLEPQPPPAQPAPAGPVLPERLGLPLPAALEALAIGLLEFSAPELELRARSIDGQVAFDGSHWRIERLRAAVETPGLETPCRPQCTLALRGALGSERPFALSATLEAQGQLQDSALRARIAVDGQLHAETGLPLGARVEGRWQALALDVDARLDPFAPTARGKLRLSNAEPGPLDAQRWPVARVATGFEYSADALRLTDIAIHDRADAEQATVTGSGTLSTRDLAGRFELAAEALDLSRLHGRLLGSALSGAIELVLGDREIRFDASLREARAPVAAKLRGLARPDRVLLEHVELDAYGGHARASASLELTGARSLQAQAQFERFDPSRIAQLPAMRLAGRLEADLKLEPAPAGTVNLTLADSRLHGRALSLRARASGALRKPAVELDASLGPSKLAASGRLDADDRKARIDWKLDLAEPQLIDPRLEGRVRASGRFAGDPLAPQVELRAEADRLAYDTVELRAVALKITGEPRRHRIELAGRHAGAGFRLDASGALPGRLDQLDAASGWTGRIDVLRIEAPVPVSLSAPAELAVGAGRASLGPTRLAVGAGHLQAQQLSLRDGSIDSSGSFARIAPAPWLQWLGITERTSGMGIADLALSGEWSLRYRPDAPAAERLAGRIGIERSAGDLSIRLPAGDGTSRPRPLGLERVRVDAVIDTDATDLSLALRSLRGTSVDASARITVDPDQPFGMPVTIVSSGRLGGLEPAYWLALLRPGVLAPGVDASSLRLGAGWSLQWRPRSGAADALSGEAFVERESGDVTVKAGSTTIALQLGATRLGLRAAEGGLEARLGLASGRELGIDGSARAGLAAVPGSIAIARTAPWSGRLEGSLALGPLARLVTDELLLDGRLKASVELAGTPQQPLLQGSIEGDGLQVVHPESGLRLIDGSLRAQVAGQNIEVRHWVMYMPDPAASAAPDTAAPARPATAAPAKPETGAPAKPGAAPAAGRERDRTA